MPRKILVTGADGFIGSHLVETLVKCGAEVRAFVLYNSYNSWGWLDNCADDVMGEFEVVPGDVRDAYGIRAAMTGCDTVFHLAALIAIPFSYKSPGAYVDTNVHGTLNVLQAARDLAVDRVIHTSTSEVYGTAQYVPIDESHPIIGQSPYSATKIAADQLALSFHRSFGLPVAVVRPFNTYGPRQSARAVLPTIMTQLLSGDQRVRLGNLTPTRDFSFVSDTVAGMMAIASCEQAVGEVVNLGSGFEVSIGKAVEVIADMIGTDVDVVSETARYRPEGSEVERLLSDNVKARRLAGWEPRYAGLEGFRRGIAETIEWLRDPSNIAHYKPAQYNI